MSALTLAQLAGLASFSLIMATGQILFKQTADTMPPIQSARSLLALGALPSFWAACLLYGAATLLWIKLLQSVPLSRAYPFVALGFVLVPAAAMLLFREPLTLRYGAGALLIMVGIWLSVQS
jgi:drug/metabolite transporter (DMT)-like permease